MNNVKRLYRSEKEQMLAGVCAGLAEYFEIDPTIVRIIFIILLFTPFNGGILYILLWMVIPLESAVKSGKAHGDAMRDNLEDLKLKTKSAFEKARHEAENFGKQAHHGASNVAEQARDTAEDVRDVAAEKVEEARHTAENVRTSVEENVAKVRDAAETKIDELRGQAEEKKADLEDQA